MPNPPTIRSYTPDDLEALAALRLGHAPSPTEGGALARWLAQPNIDAKRDCMLAFNDDGAPAGFAILIREPAIRRGVVEVNGSNQHRGGGAGDALLWEVYERGRAAGLDVVQVDVPESDEARRKAFAERGWAHIRTHLHLRREGTERTNVPAPDGMTLRLAEPVDAPAVTDVQNTAFTGSWGYAPNTPAEIAYRIFELPDLRPDPVVLLEEDGALVGYCWCHREAEDAPGIVGMVGVLPGRQGKGLGRAVTGAGMDALLELGSPSLEITVDSENPPAIRVYESLGFVLDWRSFWYELRLT
ncbi:MAG: GNAT family N-acetyltransferase [Chloroflexi bacterium]|nr:GNAT family N-acetyltransferase [Chloroflexota bacterium]MXY59407.1 GNAT family N-acetyltransferase [Chloroflexota bacterium]MYB83216.1 GNAT family N-acetyltransferase [Chloroflexota bacterium]